MNPEYFQKELGNLRDLSKDFAKKHPALAPLLLGESADPDVERILEGTAFLAAMVQEKIDDHLPEIINSLAELIFPHYLKPVPSMTIMRLTPKPSLVEPLIIPAGTCFASLPVNGSPCIFASAREMPLLPLTLSDCAWATGQDDRNATLRMRFATHGVPMSAWKIDSLRLFFSGEFIPACERYRMLHSLTQALVVREHGSERALSLSGNNNIRVTGFADEDAVLPYTKRSFFGFRLLQEFFAFPEKFLFLDIVGLSPFFTGASGKGFDLEFILPRECANTVPVRTEHVALHAVPAVNLFPHDAEPIQMNFRQPEYKLTPGGNADTAYEIHSILDVTGMAPGGVPEKTYRPFGLFTFREDATPVYSQKCRRRSQEGKPDWFIATANPGAQSFEEEFRQETLSVTLLCTNGRLPESLKTGDVREATDSSPVLATFENISVPTPYYRPHPDGEILWRLVSHMYVNYFPVGDLSNLQALLRLYIHNSSSDRGRYAANIKRVESLTGLETERENRLVDGVMARGVAVRLTADPAGFACPGELLIFGHVLDRFFSSYASLNCFTLFSLINRESKEVLAWPTRLGKSRLL